MKVTKFNISKPAKYTVKGEEKTRWDNVGTMTEFLKDDNSISRIIEIPLLGLEAKVFAMVDNVTRAPRTEETDEINPEDVAF